MAKKKNINRYQIFVSHATADKSLAMRLCEQLETVGASTFRDDRDIDGGDDIPERIALEIKRSREFVVLLTPHSVNRPWVLLEVGAAWGWNRKMRITPVLCHVDVDPIPGMLKSKKAIHLNDFDTFLAEVKNGWRITMPNTTPTYDVFVSYDRRDAGTATEIAQIMESYGLKVFTETEFKLGQAIEETLWDAIAESLAFVAIIPERELSASIALELGAAKAWNKPVYAIAANPSSTRLPVDLHGLVVYPLSRADEVAQQIKQSMKSLTDSETAVLIEEYHRIGMPVDELLLQAKQLSTLTREFVKRTKRQIAAEELVRMLLRLRKQGLLRAGKRTPPHKAS